MLVVCVSILLSSMVAVLVGIVVASSPYNRILMANLFSTYGVVLVMVLGVLLDAAPYFVDVCLVYACVGLVSAMGFFRFFWDDWKG